jgi:hypothetical protein
MFVEAKLENMTTQEFLELADKNGAILTPEETEKCRQKTMEWFTRHQIYVGMFGDWHAIDTHSWGYKICQFVTGCFEFCFGLFLLFLSAFLLFTLFF